MIEAQEMLDLPHGFAVEVISDECGQFENGQVIFRHKHVLDDLRSSFFSYQREAEDDEGSFMLPEEVKYISSNPQCGVPEELGTFRPELGTRKVGKVRVELVDDGFPLALREIAKVLTWAQTAKGYKDHDWQNLPDAEVQLAAATSRHRTDHIKQRTVEGLSIEDCVDSESSLLHKAHEAFGVLAQLELMLRGKF